jgi:hypothetical protein
MNLMMILSCVSIIIFIALMMFAISYLRIKIRTKRLYLKKDDFIKFTKNNKLNVYIHNGQVGNYAFCMMNDILIKCDEIYGENGIKELGENCTVYSS